MKNLPNELDRIIFCSDLLRINNDDALNETSINANTNMIFSLFAPLIYGVMQTKCKKIELMPLYGAKGGLSSVKFSTYRKLGLPLDTSSWSYIFANEDTKEIIFDSLDNFFSNKVLVIGYEIPPYMIKYFNKKEIPFIDIRINAIRFLKDYMFSFYSNIDAIQRKISSVKISEDIIYRTAMLFSARAQMIFKSLPDYSNSVLFLGQTTCDSSLISNNKMATEDDVIEAIYLLSLSYEKIFYKRHPYNNNKNIIEKIVKSCSSCKILDYNVYDALTIPFAKIASLSSGTNIEAKYFGRESIWMLNELHLPYIGTISTWQTTPIYKLPFFIEFWDYLLGDNEKLELKNYEFDYSETGVKFVCNLRWGK